MWRLCVRQSENDHDKNRLALRKREEASLKEIRMRAWDEKESGKVCSGLMKPDTHLGENARQIEVSDDQTTPFLFC
ncbi:hypothetical protein EMIT0P253_20336 [Pseudomonas sp. IT-P253]|jgi:hypothetical protein